MSNQAEKSEFIAKVEQMYEELNQLLEADKDGKTKRGLIILASECPEDSEETHHITAMSGHALEQAKCVADLAVQEGTNKVFKLGMLIASKRMESKNNGIHIITL